MKMSVFSSSLERDREASWQGCSGNHSQLPAVNVDASRTVASKGLLRSEIKPFLKKKTNLFMGLYGLIGRVRSRTAGAPGCRKGGIIGTRPRSSRPCSQSGELKFQRAKFNIQHFILLLLNVDYVWGRLGGRCDSLPFRRWKEFDLLALRFMITRVPRHPELWFPRSPLMEQLLFDNTR